MGIEIPRCQEREQPRTLCPGPIRQFRAIEQSNQSNSVTRSKTLTNIGVEQHGRRPVHECGQAQSQEKYDGRSNDESGSKRKV
jgi:hypothetical protein